jgi:hypothetical protein
MRVEINVDRRFGSRLRHGKYEMAICRDVPKKSNLARNTDLRKDCLCAIGGFAPVDTTEAARDFEIAVSFGRELGAGNQLPVVQVKNARRKQKDKRTDEQTEIQV